MKHLRTMKFFTSRLIVVGLLSGMASAALAQNADELLNRLSQEAKSYGSIEATYVSTMEDKVSDFDATQSGTIYIDGSKYHLNIGDYIIISDGVTIWTYETAVNDCYVDDAEVMAEEGMDPSKLFTIWEDEFKNEWKGRATIQGQEVTQINLYPNGAEEKPFHTIQLYINEKELRLVRAIVKGREGTDVTYDVKTFKPRAQVDPGRFTFNPAKFPGVNIIDNRL